MYLHYFYWQYMVAPLWLARFFWTLQQMLLQLFSVRLMIVTLFSHWHKDRVRLAQGSISGIIRAALLNTISRAVGFCVRVSVLALWAVSECIFLILAAGSFVAFCLAPLVALLAVAYGVALLVSGG